MFTHTDEWMPFHQKNLWYLLFIINIKISPEKKILNVIYTTLEQLTNNNTIITVNKLLSNKFYRRNLICEKFTTMDGQ
jgi:hypothetical protein